MKALAVTAGLVVLVVIAPACGSAGTERQSVKASTDRSPEQSQARSETQPEPELVAATLEPSVAHVGDLLTISITNVVDRDVRPTENYLPLRHVTEAGRKMVWAVPVESTYQTPVPVREDGWYSVNDIGWPGPRPGSPGASPIEPGVTYTDQVKVPDVEPGRYEFVVAVCRGAPGEDCGPRLTGDDCFIHGCPAQTVELELTVTG